MGYSFPGTVGTFTSSKRGAQEQVWLYRRDARTGTGLLVTLFLHLRLLTISWRCADAPDFYESSFWKDSKPCERIGRMGRSSDGLQRFPDGGFQRAASFLPFASHSGGRNFTLQPWKGGRICAHHRLL